MSNKSRLQINNTNLQALIDKANALPDAGGSGGIETCTVRFNIPDQLSGTETICYLDSSGMPQTVLLYTISNITVLKNSFLFSTNYMEAVGENIKVKSHYNGITLFFITGDCTIRSEK